MKKLYKSKNNKILAGVVGGLGEYLDIDPVVLRVMAVFLCFSTGVFPFTVGYMITCFIIPSKSAGK